MTIDIDSSQLSKEELALLDRNIRRQTVLSELALLSCPTDKIREMTKTASTEQLEGLVNGIKTAMLIMQKEEKELLKE